ncbi:aldose 1-epimerase family protein [Alloscardovia omnicolens]|jgi:putative aldose-1-epimerase|uniref:aldose 1-epimerase family protein n=1 Tax=Alloscardovia omnicolens TaxID=419015 RepID=UPI00254B5C70|nr:aldose 1-epimerase family protein [Alloscardovia omnicolens]MDK6249093.1 aldose 1-epimerase family protein [Alloscardovia omnicolens]
MAGILPSRAGQEYTIHAGSYTAVVTEQGAALESFTINGKDIVVPFDPNYPVKACSGQILIPYPNRIEDGEYSFEGKDYSFPIDEHERHNSIHGLGYRYPWKLEALSTSSVSLSWRTPNLASYPFDLLVTVTYTVHADDGLQLSIEAFNNGDTNAPWALATHPWFASGSEAETTAKLDAANGECRLNLPARTHVTVNDRLLPTGLEAVDGTRYDLREGNPLGIQSFDDAWTDLDYAADGSVQAVFTRPDGIEVLITGDETITSFQVCNGFGWEASHKPAGVAIEPQTAYANAFKSGKDVIVIEPGRSSRTTISYAAREVK